jgi:hypothetical protein
MACRVLLFLSLLAVIEPLLLSKHRWQSSLTSRRLGKVGALWLFEYGLTWGSWPEHARPYWMTSLCIFNDKKKFKHSLGDSSTLCIAEQETLQKIDLSDGIYRVELTGRSDTALLVAFDILLVYQGYHQRDEVVWSIIL